MLGVVRADQKASSVTAFFAETTFENMFVVDEEQCLQAEIHHHEWRRLLALGIDDQTCIELLLSSYDEIERKCRTPARVALKSRFPRIEAKYDEPGHRIVHTEIRMPSPTRLDAHGLIMAGGFGRRLGDLTKTTPKPMLDVGGKPIAEHLLDNLVDNGISDIFVSLFFEGDVVTNHFGDGSSFGARVRYLKETTPFGTAGCLSLLPREIKHPLLVVNGDVITTAQFGRLVEFHNAAGYDITVSVRPFPIQMQFGVIDQVDGLISRIREKPKIIHQINVAIYVLSPSVLEHVPAGKVDMPSLIETLIPLGFRVGAFPLIEDWIDVGTLPDLERARIKVEAGHHRHELSIESAKVMVLKETKAAVLCG
ncbi:NTP transferase domain-containing protein (plasmid) [Mesorhizobium sp. AR07]|uniref:nucleotidyltransferase family protein n=1 Tax=Mesorhizobium sp. AR07 TaxID=2865838 RepID=UPI00215E707A|nr:sugar phosphate nucleotidyltransferase [Mesorhizobium sp. AR07]UVK48498.1 NTP transferase domain-containing protein [Mesorhizobium sp. AR07]